jgi:hypothetical protein
MSTDPMAPHLEARRALAASSTDDLLTAYATLTHRIHSHSMADSSAPSDRGLREAAIVGLRAQRDLIRTEILHRTGDLARTGEI